MSGNGDNGNGTVEQTNEARPATVKEVLAKLDRQEAAAVPEELPTPYPLGDQEYPGTALWQTTKTPEDYAAGLRALASYDPPHVLAERAANKTS